MKKLLITIACLTAATVSMGKEVVAKTVYTPGEFQGLATLPSFTISAPSGLAGSWGSIFAGAAGRTNSDETDAAIAFGMGLGNAYEFIGGTAVLGVGSVDPRDGGAFNRGSLDLNFGHNFSQHGLGVSAGITNINLWRADSADDNDPSLYLAGTKLFSNNIAPVIFTAGLGNNGYVSYKRGGDYRDKIDGFAAIAAYVHPQISLIADYTAGLTAVGVSLVPVKHWPVNLTLGLDDIFEQSQQEKVSFIATISAAYKF